ncbi:MAG: peptidoglycan D,D-transpeptidase FtsI family protein [Bilifractor sp.]
MARRRRKNEITREKEQIREQKMLARKVGTRTRKKILALFLVVVVAFVGLACRITYINATEGEQYSRIVLSQEQQQYESRTIAARRGDITDRNGTILASSEKVYNVILDCKVVNTEVEELDGSTSQKYIEPTVKALVDVLGIDEDTIRSYLTDDSTKNSQYIVLEEGISIDEKQKFEDYVDTTSDEYAELSEEEQEERANVKGVWFEEDYVREYPLDSLACDTIGFTYDGTTADWGIEGYYSDILNGTDGREYGYFDDSGSDVEQTIIPAEDGYNVVSTIDVNVQQIIRNALENFEEEMATDDNKTNGAENIGVIVMDPNSGEILGMDSDRWYDLNNPRDLTQFYTDSEIADMSDDEMLDALNEIWQNYCISDAYELGSVFKPVVAASALSCGAVDMETEFTCDGGEQVADKYIACESVHGTITLSEAIKKSCNDSMMQIASLMGEDNFLKYQNIFNFGMKTGIDLPGETSGLVFDEDTMGSVEMATSSFGQGFTATMIQEISAICAAINGGYYYQPHVVKEITDSDGNVVKTIDPVVEKRTNSEEVSAEIRQVMGEVMESDGTGYVAKIPGYTMGGKTGTAEKLPRGNNKYVLSFVNFAPLDDPQVVVYVTVDEPNTDAQETTVYAMSIARNIMVELLPYLGIYPDEDGYTLDDIDTTLATNAGMLNHEYTTAENGVTLIGTEEVGAFNTSDSTLQEVELADNGLVDTDGDGVGDTDQSEVDANGNGYLDSTEDSGTSSTDSSGDTTESDEAAVLDEVSESDSSYLYQDTTLGTASDGSELPTLSTTDETEEDVETNDYFSDGYTNEDVEEYTN